MKGEMDHTLRVFVLLAHSLGARVWNERWRNGRLAGIHESLPYGYFHCAGDGCIVDYSQDRQESRVMQFARMCLRRLLGFDLIHAWRNRDGIARADVVWTHTELEHLAILMLFRVGLIPGRRPKLIAQSVWLFDRWPQMSRLRRRVYRWLLEEADILTVHSPENLQTAQQLFPAKQCEFVRFGIDSSRMRPVERRPAGSPVRILALGNDMHRDWITLLEALGGWSECEVRMGGKRIGWQLRRIARRFANCHIITPTTTAETDQLYEWADLVVVPLKRNLHASGITVITEAILYGVPVICTDTGGLRAYFGPGEITYIAPLSPQQLRLAVVRLSADVNVCVTMARRAQARIIQSNLSSVSFAMRHLEISRALLDEGGHECPKRAERRSTDSRMRVFVFLGHGFGARWARGGLPGINEALPYGYYHARDEGCDVTYSKDAPETGVVELARLMLRRLLGFDLIHAWRNRRAMSEADVVWTHTELESLAVLALFHAVSSKAKPRIIAQSVWLFGRWREFWLPKRWLYRRLLSRADLLTVQCRANLAEARKVLPEKMIQVVPYGIALDRMVPTEKRPIHERIRVLSLGRDMHRDWDTLLSAIAGQADLDVRIGPRKIDRSAARRAGNLTLINPTSDEIPKLYHWADLVVVPLKPNLHASGITVLAEAALFGVPVVCTSTGGLDEYFDDKSVKYVAAGDAEAMRRAIRELAASARQRFELARNAQARLLEYDLSTRARARRLAAMSRELLTPEHRADTSERHAVGGRAVSSTGERALSWPDEAEVEGLPWRQ
jgi:glycosyltransferase involved in cell wall biosynthesis